MKNADLAEYLDKFSHQVRSAQFVLPLAQRQVLMILAKEKAVNLSQLATLRQVKKSTMSVLMNQLIDQQLVVCGQAKSDRRQRLYMLSRLGKEKLTIDRDLYDRWLDKLTDSITAQEKRVLIKILKQFCDNNVRTTNTD